MKQHQEWEAQEKRPVDDGQSLIPLFSVFTLLTCLKQGNSWNDIREKILQPSPALSTFNV